MIPRIASVAAVFLAFSTLVSATVPVPTAASAERSEIFVAPFKDGKGKTVRLIFIGISYVGFGVDKPVKITGTGSDDGQPSFLPDSSGILFVSNRDGQQRDVYRYDIAKATTTQITKTVEDEQWPIVTPDGQSFSVLRGVDQRLWRVNLDGSDVAPVFDQRERIGGYAWLSSSQIAALIPGADGAPNSLQLVDVSSGATEVVESNAGRTIRVRSPKGTLMFVQRPSKGDPVIKEFDPATKKIVELAPATDGGGDDVMWTPKGGLIMTAASQLFLREDETDRWIELNDLHKAGVNTITQIVVSPDGKWVAIVSSK